MYHESILINLFCVARSLKMLGNVKLAEEGMLRVLFSAVYLLSHKNRNDNQISAVSR